MFVCVQTTAIALTPSLDARQALRHRGVPIHLQALLMECIRRSLAVHPLAFFQRAGHHFTEGQHKYTIVHPCQFTTPGVAAVMDMSVLHCSRASPCGAPAREAGLRTRGARPLILGALHSDMANVCT
jgi:hypothetical protein